MPGTEVCRVIRTTSQVPVIMLTAKDSEVDIVVGLELGADDYVTKPYSSRELLARMRAVLRRAEGPDLDMDERIVEGGRVRIDIDRHTVAVDGTVIPMPLKEFELHEVLMRPDGAPPPASAADLTIITLRLPPGWVTFSHAGKWGCTVYAYPVRAEFGRVAWEAPR
jgi:DNA-binding response OmpR family regulator